MPTIPKLIAAVMVAFIAWIGSGLVKTEVLAVYETYNFGWFVWLSVGVGLLCGWRVLGRHADGTVGLATAASVGVTAVAATVFWVLFLVSANEMLRLALARRFNGPVEAIQEIIPIAGEYGQFMMHTDIIVTLVVGGMIAGLLTNVAARHWN